MSETNVEAWLSQEADDLLDVGPFGLHELIWWLNGSPIEDIDYYRSRSQPT